MHRRRGQWAFILLEVMIAIVIVAVAMVALIRGLVVSMTTISRIRDNERAMLLAESLLDDLILEPPAEGSYDGEFVDDPRFGEGWEGWYWELEVEAETPDYDERPTGKLPQELEQLYIARLAIGRELDRDDRREFITLQTILLEPDTHSVQSIRENQLF